jgi:2-octaprenyl-6-methoxyphenol hydroxylase
MILITGNNLTAKTLFLLLKKVGVNCILLAKNYSSEQHSKYREKFASRTMAISGENINTLGKIVDIKKIIQISGEIKEIYIKNSIKSNNPEIIFKADDYGLQNMGYIIGYNTLCDEIELELQKYSEFIIKNIASVDYKNNEFQIAGDDRSIIAKTVIFTDDSCLEDFNIEKSNSISKSYNESAITLNIKHKNSHHNIAIEHFTHLGPLASLPMSDQFFSNIVRTVPQNVADSITKMSKEEKNSIILDELIKPLEYDLGEIEIVSDVSIFPLELRINKQTDLKNIIYFGTYNFAMHPIAGQGFNVILRDIARITVLAQNSKIDEFKIKISRKIDIGSMLLITDCLNEFFKIKNPLISKIRGVGMTLFNTTPWIKKFAFKNAIGNGFFNKI